MTTKRTDNVPEDWDEKNHNHKRKLAQAVNNVLKGRLNCTGQFITSGSRSTTVSDHFCGLNTVVLIVPTSEAAYSMDIFPSTVGRGSFVTTSNSLTATFNYVLLG